MVLAATPACPHCGKPVKLDECHVRVPYRRQHWWQWGAERSEFRCRTCHGYSALRLSRWGMALYTLQLGAMAWGWQAGMSRAGLIGGGAVLAVLLYRHAVSLGRS